MSILDGKPGSMLVSRPVLADVQDELKAAQARCADLERQLSEERQRTAAVQATVDLASQRAARAETAAAVERQRADDAIARAQSAVSPDVALRVQLDAEIAGRARAEGELAAIKAQIAAEEEDDAMETEEEVPPTYIATVTKRDGNDRIVSISLKPEV